MTGWFARPEILDRLQARGVRRDAIQQAIQAIRSRQNSPSLLRAAAEASRQMPADRGASLIQSRLGDLGYGPQAGGPQFNRTEPLQIDEATRAQYAPALEEWRQREAAGGMQRGVPFDPNNPGVAVGYGGEMRTQPVGPRLELGPNGTWSYGMPPGQIDETARVPYTSWMGAKNPGFRPGTIEETYGPAMGAAMAGSQAAQQAGLSGNAVGWSGGPMISPEQMGQGTKSKAEMFQASLPQIGAAAGQLGAVMRPQPVGPRVPLQPYQPLPPTGAPVEMQAPDGERARVDPRDMNFFRRAGARRLG